MICNTAASLDSIPLNSIIKNGPDNNPTYFIKLREGWKHCQRDGTPIDVTNKYAPGENGTFPSKCIWLPAAVVRWNEIDREA